MSKPRIPTHKMTQTELSLKTTNQAGGPQLWAHHTGCSLSKHSQWRALSALCITDIQDFPDDELASGTMTTTRDVRFLGNGIIAFTIESRDHTGARVKYRGGDSYSVWLRKWPLDRDSDGAQVATGARDAQPHTCISVTCPEW